MVCEFEPVSGSVPTAQSLEPASDSVTLPLFPSLSAPPRFVFCLSLSLKINIKKKVKGLDYNERFFEHTLLKNERSARKKERKYRYLGR